MSDDAIESLMNFIADGREWHIAKVEESWCVFVGWLDDPDGHGEGEHLLDALLGADAMAKERKQEEEETAICAKHGQFRLDDPCPCIRPREGET